MGQNSKVVHRPDKPLKTAELEPLIQEEIIQSRTASFDYKPSFYHCEPYPVRFEPMNGLVVHAETNEIAHLCMNGPMDTNSVKNSATVMDIRQKLSYTDF